MSDNDLYSEFDTLASSPVIRTIIGSNRSSGPNSPGDAFGSLMPPGGPLGPTLRPPTMAMFSMGGDVPLARPMTSVAGAGFSSAMNRPKLFDPLMQAANITSLASKPEATPQQQAQTMEKNVHALLEESINAGLEGQYTRALERAKECAKKERLLNKFREKHQLPEQNNVDLTFAVCMNLGQQYHANGMLQDALNTYAMIVKNKAYQPGSRLRVNMGNIYYQQKKYPSAIKMYRMAMDQIGQTNKDMRSNIMRNIGDCFVKLGQFSAAIDTYEAVIDAQPDPQSAFNLVICYYALGDKEKMKKGFIQLLSSRFDNGRRDGKDIDDEADEHDIDIEAELLEHDEKMPDDPNRKLLSPLREKTTDELAKYVRGKKKSLARYVLTAAQLIAPVIERDASSGYDWVIMHLQAPHKITASGSVPKPGFASIAAQLTIAKGVAYLKQKNIPAAIEVFKALEKQDSELVDHAATNLSFLYFLEGDYKSAEKYADIAVRADRYNAKALVNKANILFVNGLLEQAKELYLEAIGVEADCLEAIYNLGIVNKRMGALEDALQAFKKLHRILPKENQVIYHIGNLYDLQDDPVQASEWFSILHAGVPTDPKILARLGALASKQKDDNQAFPHYIESYNCFPASMDVITWLGVWFVRNEHYEKAIQFFLRAAEVEPEEMKWQLMVASCYRRMGSFSQALQLYKDIHKQDPDNLECLRYLCSLCKDTNDQEYEQYAKLLRKAEKQQQVASGASAMGPAHPAPSASPVPRSSPSVGADMRLNLAEAESTPMGGVMGSEERPAVELNETLTKPLEPKAVRTFQPREKNEDDDPWDDGDDILPDA